MVDRTVAAKIVSALVASLRDNYVGIACTHSWVRTVSGFILMLAFSLEAITTSSVTMRGDHNW
jgi:hypothetical protein